MCTLSFVKYRYEIRLLITYWLPNVGHGYKRSNLNQTDFEGFEALRIFVVHKINIMTLDYAQALFKTNEDKVLNHVILAVSVIL